MNRTYTHASLLKTKQIQQQNDVITTDREEVVIAVLM